MSADSRTRVADIVRDAGKHLLRYIRSRVSNEADAEDILQDVWQRLVVAIDAGPIEQVGAWLYTVARNRIIDRYREPFRSAIDTAALLDSEPDLIPVLRGFVLREEATPETEHLKRAFWEQLHRALEEVPTEQRQVFVWHELEGLTFREMAELTGENINTLLARKRYAVLHLRTRLEPLRAEFNF